jgi:hypothetical protein
MALALLALGADDGAGLARDLDGAVAAVVVVDVDGRAGQRGAEAGDRRAIAASSLQHGSKHGGRARGGGSGRLQHQVAGVHDERLALVLVDDAHPAAPDEDQLEGDAVEMDPVGDRAAVGNGDVRRDVAPAEPAGIRSR